MAEGRDSREIAGALGVSTKAVAKTVSRVPVELHARDRVEGALRARGER